MPKLIYITNASLDGYIEDRTGAFDWVKSDHVFDFITGLLRPIGTHLLGRRLYETMAYSDRDLFIGGGELAGLALASSLVDECHLFLNPVIVGGGKPAFPADMADVVR